FEMFGVDIADNIRGDFIPRRRTRWQRLPESPYQNREVGCPLFEWFNYDHAIFKSIKKVLPEQRIPSLLQCSIVAEVAEIRIRREQKPDSRLPFRELPYPRVRSHLA